jgi:transcriptional regulator with XRE-family HTH domain
MPKLESGRAASQLGPLLRGWRESRGRSQIDLSLDSGISQRHISFMESGRSVPSRQTLLDVAQALDVPLRERNVLLLAAGYAPMYPDVSWDDRSMQSVSKALKRVLRQHEPFPAIAMDRYWNVLLRNDAVVQFFGRFIDMSARTGSRNFLHLMFDPDGMRPFVHNWEAVGRGLIARVYRESIGRVADPGTRKLLDELLAYPGVPAEWARPSVEGSADEPVIPYSFMRSGRLLSYFSMVTTVGSPQSVPAQEVRLECMFPADDETESQHLELMATPPATVRRN